MISDEKNESFEEPDVGKTEFLVVRLLEKAKKLNRLSKLSSKRRGYPIKVSICCLCLFNVQLVFVITQLTIKFLFIQNKQIK